MRNLFFASLFCLFAQAPGARDLFVATATPEGARAVLTAARQERRVALIIGNDAYADAPLRNAVNDARSIDKALTEIEHKFETLVVENATLKHMQRAVALFVDSLKENDVALIYYAGHGIQLGDENFLVPVDFAAEDAASAKFAAFNANELLERVGAKKPKLLMVLLDACRNNPFKVSRSMGTGGLAPVGAGVKGSIIVLSTAPGRTASDNPTGDNTFFNIAVVENIRKKDMEVNEMFNAVKRSVSGMSNDEQRPWTNSDYAGRWYFHPPDDFLPADIDPAVSERLYQSAQQSGTREDFATAANLFDQLVARETDSPMGVAAAREAKFLRALESLYKAAPGEVSAARIERLENAWKLEPFRAASHGLQAAAQKLALGDAAGSVAMLTRLRGNANEETAFRARKMLTALASVSPEAKLALDRPLEPEAAPPPAVMPESRFRKIAEELAREVERRAAIVKAEKEAAAKEAALVPVVTPVVEATNDATPSGRRIRIAAISIAEPVPPAPVELAAEPVQPPPARRNAPRVPLVNITSTPTGAAVNFVEPGIAPCVTPCAFRAPPGRYTATLSLPGYRPELRILAVAMPGAELTVELAAKQGKVLLECGGAVLPLEFETKLLPIKCPGEVLLPPGQYEFTLWDDTVRLQRVRVNVTDNGLETARFTNR